MSAPDLPYARGGRRTSGWSGSEASQQAVEEQDERGRTLDQQQQALAWLRKRSRYGGTQAELQLALECGHGTASRVLSVLHQSGKIERLSIKRLRSHIYVHPAFVSGRQLSGYRRLESREVLRQRITELEEALRMVLAHPGKGDVIAEANLALRRQEEM